jgi:hypothetical protein
MSGHVCAQRLAASTFANWVTSWGATSLNSSEYRKYAYSPTILMRRIIHWSVICIFDTAEPFPHSMCGTRPNSDGKRDETVITTPRHDHAQVTKDRRSGGLTDVRGSKPSLEKRTIAQDVRTVLCSW